MCVCVCLLCQALSSENKAVKTSVCLSSSQSMGTGCRGQVEWDLKVWRSHWMRDWVTAFDRTDSTGGIWGRLTPGGKSQGSEPCARLVSEEPWEGEWHEWGILKEDVSCSIKERFEGLQKPRRKGTQNDLSSGPWKEELKDKALNCLYIQRPALGTSIDRLLQDHLTNTESWSLWKAGSGGKGMISLPPSSSCLGRAP